MTETRYPALEAAWADMERAKTKVTAVVWKDDHDVILALMSVVDDFKNVLTAEWQRAYSERSVTPDDYTVHITHCCKEHGCKYGYDKHCPVAAGIKAQKYECEDCEWEKDPDG